MPKIKTYNELVKLHSFRERYNYLKLSGVVGRETFGYDRYLNQILYRSRRWKQVRDVVILRDKGCDLGVRGHEIYSRVIIHHMNAITIEDIEENRDEVFDPQFLICVSHNTHEAIHYGDENILVKPLIKRRKNDTCPWKV